MLNVSSRNLLRTLIVGLAVGCLPFRGALGQTNRPPAVAVGAAGDLKPAVVTAVAQYLRSNLTCRVETIDPTQYEGPTLDDEGQKVRKSAMNNYDCIILIVNSTNYIAAHSVWMADFRVMVLNYAALSKELTTAFPEPHLRRLKKESMRAVAITYGVPFCPYPRCAIWSYRDYKTLDTKSINFCPPHAYMIDLEIKARRAGQEPEKP